MQYDFNDRLPLALGAKVQPEPVKTMQERQKETTDALLAMYPGATVETYATAWAGSIGITDGDMAHPSAPKPPVNVQQVGRALRVRGDTITFRRWLPPGHMVTADDMASIQQEPARFGDRPLDCFGGKTPREHEAAKKAELAAKWRVGNYCDHAGYGIDGGRIVAIFADGSAEVQYRKASAQDGFYNIPLAELNEHIPF